MNDVKWSYGVNEIYDLINQSNICSCTLFLGDPPIKTLWWGFLNTRSLRNKKCRFVLSLHVFPGNIWKTRDWKGEFDLPADALSTPSSFHCCLSQVPITCRCLPPLLVCCARVVLECSATESRKERAGKYNHSLFRFS